LFKKIELDNYRSFRHIDIDLTGSEKAPLPYAFIYGENGSGKSNLIESVMFLKDAMKTFNIANRLRKFLDERNKTDRGPSVGTRGDGTPYPDVSDPDEIIRTLSTHPSDLTHIAKNVRTVGTDTGASMSYHFVLRGHDGNYVMKFGPDGRLIYEKLSFVVESRTKDIFEISVSENDDLSDPQIVKKFSPQLFLNKDYGEKIEDLIEKYWGKHSFVSMLDEERYTSNRRYLKESLGTGILDVIEFFNELVVSCKFTGGDLGMGIRDEILAKLAGGYIAPEKRGRLLTYETALNSFFTRIYSDVKKVYYRTESQNGELYYTLFFSKIIGGKRREIPIFSESTGTLKLLELFPAFFECARGRTVFFDELDSGIHDLLMKKIMCELKDSFKGQFVATTHNTSLLEVMDPKNIFVIQIDREGEKRILPISRIERTQKNHNNRNRYLNGVFDAIPITGEIEFGDIVRYAVNEFGDIL